MKMAIKDMKEGQKFKTEEGEGLCVFKGLRHSFRGTSCYFVNSSVMNCSPLKQFELAE